MDFLMSWNRFEFTYCNTLRRVIVGCIHKLLLLLLLLLVMMMTMKLSCMCIVSAMRAPKKWKKENKNKNERKKNDNEWFKMKSWRKKWNEMLCSVCVCSWLHTNNDDHEKNICSQPTSNKFFFSLFHRCLIQNKVFFFCFQQNYSRKFVAFWPIPGNPSMQPSEMLQNYTITEGIFFFLAI